MQERFQKDPDEFQPRAKPEINPNSVKLVNEQRKKLGFMESQKVWQQLTQDKKKLLQIELES